MKPVIKIKDFNKLSRESRDSMYRILLKDEISDLVLIHGESAGNNTLVFTATSGSNSEKKCLCADWFEERHIIRDEIEIKEDESGMVSNLDEIDEFVLAKAYN